MPEAACENVAVSSALSAVPQSRLHRSGQPGPERAGQCSVQRGDQGQPGAGDREGPGECRHHGDHGQQGGPEVPVLPPSDAGAGEGGGRRL